jgi:hypothetical protein
MAGPGQVTLDPPSGSTRRIRVWNFDTSHVELKPEHEPGMERLALPLLRGRRPPPFVHLIGTASRRGSFDLNQRLSQGRVDNVRAALVGLLQRERVPVPLNGLSSFVAQGELPALLAGRPENDNSDTDRAVVIEITDSPVPTTNVRLRRLPVPDDRDPITLTRQPVSHHFAIRVEHMGRISGGPPPLSVGGVVIRFTFWDTENMLIAQYEYRGGLRGASAPLIPIPGSLGFVGPWNCFRLSGAMRVEDFGGSAAYEEGTLAAESSLQFVLRASTVMAANRNRPLRVDPLVMGDSIGSVDLGALEDSNGWLFFDDFIGVRPFSDVRPVFSRSGLAPSCATRAGHMRRFGGRMVSAD